MAIATASVCQRYRKRLPTRLHVLANTTSTNLKIHQHELANATSTNLKIHQHVFANATASVKS